MFSDFMWYWLTFLLGMMTMAILYFFAVCYTLYGHLRFWKVPLPLLPKFKKSCNDR